MATLASNFIAVILAGGQSSRMKQDKALLPLSSSQSEGQPITLVQHMIALCKSAGAQQVLVNRSQNDFSLNPSSLYQADGLIQDVYQGLGPLAGIHAAMSQAEIGQTIVFIAVDMPLVSSDLLQTLICEQLKLAQSVYFQDQMLPIALTVTQDKIDYLTDVLNTQGNNSIRAFIKHINAVAIACRQPHLLHSANTPESWQYCLSHLSSRTTIS